MPGGFRGDRPSRADGGNQENRYERPLIDAESYEQIDYRLSMLETDLKLTPAQVPAWQAFAESVRNYATDLARERGRNPRHAGDATSPPSGLQHISQAVDAARNKMTALELIEASAKALYQGFSPDQKLLADSRIPSFVAPGTGVVGRNPISGNRPDLAPASGPPR